MLSPAHRRVAALMLALGAGSAAAIDLVPPPHLGPTFTPTVAWDLNRTDVASVPTVRFDAARDTISGARRDGSSGPGQAGRDDAFRSVIALGGLGSDDSCLGDLNGDGTVDGADLGVLLVSWGPCRDVGACPSDLDGDGDVDGADLGVLLSAWGPCPPFCPPSDHDCDETGIPGCTDPECCLAVCRIEPFCCTVAWDELCVQIALDVCVVCGLTGSGPCCVANGSPTCEDQLCCELVCAQEPFCCTVEWDGLCAEIAATFSSCGCSGTICPPSDHDCFTTGLPGCSDVPCCEQVCAVEPLCCTESWDQSCVDLAEQVCIGGFCGDPASGDCCEPNGTPYCTNQTCCEQICTVDSFCCATAWDQVCAEQAQLLLDCNCE